MDNIETKVGCGKLNQNIKQIKNEKRI